MRNNKEHRLQAFADRLIGRVVMPPFHATAVDHASVTTDNARVRFKARGGVFGFPDHIVIQDGRPVAIEFKRGSSVDGRQAAVHDAMRAAGWHVGVANTIPETLGILRDAGLRLHGNADNIAAEIEARLAARDEAMAEQKKAAPSRPQRARISPTRMGKINAVRARIQF